MKRFVLSLVCALGLGVAQANAQCTPDPNLTSPGALPTQLPQVIVNQSQTAVMTFMVAGRDTFSQSSTLGNIVMRFHNRGMTLDQISAFTTQSQAGQTVYIPTTDASITSFTPDVANGEYSGTNFSNFGGCVTMTYTAGASGNYYASITGLLDGYVVVDQFPSPPFPIPGVTLPSPGDTLTYTQLQSLINSLQGVSIPGLPALPNFDVTRLAPGDAGAPFTAANAVGAADALAAQLGFNVYPVPASANSRVEFTLPAAERVSLRLLDANGRTVAAQPAQQLAAGHHSLTLCADCATLPAGIYILQAQVGSQLLSHRVVVQ